MAGRLDGVRTVLCVDCAVRGLCSLAPLSLGGSLCMFACLHVCMCFVDRSSVSGCAKLWVSSMESGLSAIPPVRLQLERMSGYQSVVDDIDKA